MSMNFERLSLPLLLSALAGCASTAASPLDNEAFGGEPTVPAMVPTPSPDPLPSARPAAPEAALEPIAPPFESKERGNDKWEFVLFGTGASDQDVSHGSAAISGSLGRMLGDHFRRASADYYFSDAPRRARRPRVDRSLSTSRSARSPRSSRDAALFGDFVKGTWVAAPEAGLKLFLREHVFLQLMAEYQFFFDTTNEADEAFNDGSFVYSLGLGMTF
jgi:hypothetical protein